MSLRKHNQLFQPNSLPAHEFKVKGAGSSIVNLHALPHGSHVVTHSSNGQVYAYTMSYTVLLEVIYHLWALMYDILAVQLSPCVRDVLVHLLNS